MAIAIGFALAFLATASAGLIAATLPLAWLPSPYRICIGTGFDPAACSASAARIGFLCAATFVLASVLTFFAFSRSHPTAAPQPPALAQATVTDAVLVTVVGLLIAHLVARHLGPAYVSRLDELKDYSVYVSLENLTWPLLLQLMVVERHAHRWLALLGLLVMIAAISPFRATLFAVTVFGLLLPSAATLWKAAREPHRTGRSRRTRRGLVLVAMALLLGVAGIWSSFVNRTEQTDPPAANEIALLAGLAQAYWGATDVRTATRHADRPRQDVEPQAAPAGSPTAPHPTVLFDSTELLPQGRGLLQRIATPAFQAALLERYAQTHPLPGIADEILYKLHLTSRETLNRVLYPQLYSLSDVGQTTPLTYGEALAYFPGAPIVWIIAAPIVLGLSWLVLRRRGVDAEVLFGVAIWRSSLAGIVTLLPALVVQVVAFTAIRIGPVWLTRWRVVGERLQGSMRLALLGALGLLGLLCASFTLAEVPRMTVWRAALVVPRPECSFAPNLESFRTADRVLHRYGVEVRASMDPAPVVPGGPNQLYVLNVPDAARAAAFRDELAHGAAKLVSCGDQGAATESRATIPIVITETHISRNGALPLVLLSLTFLLGALGVAAARGATGEALLYVD